MAINTAAKRKTVSGIPLAHSPGVTPDASKGQDWRFASAGSYIGFMYYRLDTAEKRRSAASLPFLPMGIGITPNSAKDAEWRAQAGWGYVLGGLIARSVRSVYKTERRKIYKMK